MVQMMTELSFPNLEQLISRWRKTVKILFMFWIFTFYLVTSTFKSVMSTNLIKEDKQEPTIQELVNKHGYVIEVSFFTINIVSILYPCLFLRFD